MTARLVTGVVIALALAACSSSESPPESAPVAQSAATHVGTAACAACHTEEHEAWVGSHHDLAMQPATPATVLGDFDGATFSYAGTQTTFTRRDGAYFVRTDGPDGVLTDYAISFTFGVDPLQQYLVEFPDGRIQALSIVWDTRPAAAGGQRWYHLYPNEQITHDDVLHWTGPAQNWNFMCAECHSTKVSKNYNAAESTFATTWAEIDVSCEACHGPGSNHVEWAESGENGDARLVHLGDPAESAWIMNLETGIAQRSAPRQSQTEIETCARCHARRGLLSEDYVHGRPLLDTHRVALLDQGLYHADGQILDEVYVYGSFLQSRMHQAGVSCGDCHEPHSLELKAEGSAVCAQCHLTDRFDTPAHHHHEPETKAAQCVSCHMPSRDYMVIDARRDHSFRVPRPDLSANIGTPNACSNCHTDQTIHWAAQQVSEWYGPERPPHYGEALHAGRRQSLSANAELIRLADDDNAPAIVRATALSLLQPAPSTTAAIARATRATDPLIRVAAAEAGSALQQPEQVRVIGPLLSDPVFAVRLSAVGSLIPLPRTALGTVFAEPFAAAVEEYRAVQELNADRAESRLNLGLLLASEGDRRGAVMAYRKANELRPAFVPPYINMADLYRNDGQEQTAETILRQGLRVVPDSADLAHALGLSLVRQQRRDEALAQFEAATQRAPDNRRYAYVLGVALNSAGDYGRSIAVLEAAHERWPGDRDLIVALFSYARDAGDAERARLYSEKLLELDSGGR